MQQAIRTAKLTTAAHDRLLRRLLDAGYVAYDLAEWSHWQSWEWVGVDGDGEIVHNRRLDAYGPFATEAHSLDQFKHTPTTVRPMAPDCGHYGAVSNE